MNTVETLWAIAGLVVITLVTRGFFILPNRELPLPPWLKEGLHYAPIGALAAIVVPEIVLNQGQLIDTWRDAKLIGAAAATAWFIWRRDMLGTIIAGTAAMLVCRLLLGW